MRAAWKTVLLIVLAGVLVFTARNSFDTIRSRSVDRTDYTAVARDFILHNGFIAQRLGKVERLSHVGMGGESGRESYNVFQAWGSDKMGVLNLTLTRDDQGSWSVTEAVLFLEGGVIEVPVKRSEGDKWRLFRFD